MKNKLLAEIFGIFCFVFAGGQLQAQEPTPEIAGLQKAASSFVQAYNNRDAGAIAALFTEEGEITDVGTEELVSGREAIKALYDDVFQSEDAPSMAIEVRSVRLVAPGVAIEDGTAHLTPPGENEPPRSTDYSAVLIEEKAGSWKIASTRRLRDATEAAGQLADLAKVIKGEWTCRNAEGFQLDLAFGWDDTGKFLSGETLTVSSAGEPQPGTIRIGWDAAKKSIVSWMFDARGGANQSVWTPSEEGWLIRSEGTTADGEILTATQTLTPVNANTFIWSASNRIVDGERLPDNDLRIVRQAPEPSKD